MKSIANIILGLTLACCANAAEDTTTGYHLITSEYKTTKARDPFGVTTQVSVSTKQVAGSPMVFRLDGILYQTSDPSAIVNGTLVRRNRPVTIRTDTGEAKITAVQITRNKVVLEVNGQQVELKIGPSK